MKKYKYIIIILIIVLFSSCAVSRPVYNKDKESLTQYHQNLQKYYTKNQKK